MTENETFMTNVFTPIKKDLTNYYLARYQMNNHDINNVVIEDQARTLARDYLKEVLRKIRKEDTVPTSTYGQHLQKLNERISKNSNQCKPNGRILCNLNDA